MFMAPLDLKWKFYVLNSVGAKKLRDAASDGTYEDGKLTRISINHTVLPGNTLIVVVPSSLVPRPSMFHG